jgi:hypothetical protein
MCNGGGLRVNSSLYVQTMIAVFDDGADRSPTYVPEDKFVPVTGTVEMFELMDRDGLSLNPPRWALRFGAVTVLGLHESKEAVLIAARALLGVVTVGEAP